MNTQPNLRQLSQGLRTTEKIVKVLPCSITETEKTPKRYRENNFIINKIKFY